MSIKRNIIYQAVSVLPPSSFLSNSGRRRMIEELLQQRRDFEQKQNCLSQMDHPELSLSPSLPASTRTESNSRKRKQSYIEWPVHDPLPSDWEQCLDLKSGRMYYLNRRTLAKVWNRPYKEQKLDLELSIMPAFTDKSAGKEAKKHEESNDGGSMVAVVCLNCHLLIMLYRSSPFCPNCRHMHFFPATQPLKVLETLNLLN